MNEGVWRYFLLQHIEKGKTQITYPIFCDYNPYTAADNSR